MKAFEIYKKADPEVINGMFQWFREEDRELYKTALATLANDKKLRPAFVMKKTVPDQIAWMYKTLQTRGAAMMGEHLLQNYLMRAHSAVLTVFCDGMDIAHDGNGSVEAELPASLDEAKLHNTVNELLEKFDPELIKVYLNVFNIQTKKGWPNLTKILKSDERLQFS